MCVCVCRCVDGQDDDDDGRRRNHRLPDGETRRQGKRRKGMVVSGGLCRGHTQGKKGGGQAKERMELRLTDSLLCFSDGMPVPSPGVCPSVVELCVLSCVVLTAKCVSQSQANVEGGALLLVLLPLSTGPRLVWRNRIVVRSPFGRRVTPR